MQSLRASNCFFFSVWSVYELSWSNFFQKSSTCLALQSNWQVEKVCFIWKCFICGAALLYSVGCESCVVWVERAHPRHAQTSTVQPQKNLSHPMKNRCWPQKQMPDLQTILSDPLLQVTLRNRLLHQDAQLFTWFVRSFNIVANGYIMWGCNM